jgi:hypothetical protein
MVGEPKCIIHGLERVSQCSWCSQTICQACLEISQNKKYCPKCYQKVKGNAASSYEREANRPRGSNISNRGSLSEEQVLEARRQLGLGGVEKPKPTPRQAPPQEPDDEDI